MNKIVKCPTCHKQVDWSKSSTFRPFCSDRCRLIDLGDWASEKHVIAEDSETDSEDTSNLIDNKPDKF